MSYDLRIWSTGSLEAAHAALIEAGFEKQDGARYRYKGAGWQIVLDGHPGVMPEDVPDAAMRLRPGIRYLTEMNLEPASAPKTAHTRLRQAARLVAGAAGGVVEDPQEESYTPAGGKKRFEAPKRDKGERFSILKMSWWFEENPFGHRKGLAALLALFDRYLPEALPRRYGLHEPPPHRYEETGRDHLLDFLAEHQDELIVWYPSRPVTGVSFHPVRKSGFVRHGQRERYRCNHLSLSLDASVLADGNWRRHLAHFWKDGSAALRPFYGDVRVLGNHISGRGTHFVDMETELHPVSSGWWTGIPVDPGMAVVVGSPYRELWPAAAEAGERRGELVFLSPGDWTADGDVRTLAGRVPEEIAQVEATGWAPWGPGQEQSRLAGLLNRWGLKREPGAQARRLVHSETLPKVFPFAGGRPETE